MHETKAFAYGNKHYRVVVNSHGELQNEWWKEELTQSELEEFQKAGKVIR